MKIEDEPVEAPWEGFPQRAKTKSDRPNPPQSRSRLQTTASSHWSTQLTMRSRLTFGYWETSWRPSGNSSTPLKSPPIPICSTPATERMCAIWRTWYDGSDLIYWWYKSNDVSQSILMFSDQKIMMKWEDGPRPWQWRSSCRNHWWRSTSRSSPSPLLRSLSPEKTEFSIWSKDNLEEDLIRNVPDVVIHPTSSRVREDYWGRGDPEGVLHRELLMLITVLLIIPEGVLHGELGDVGKVDHHAQPVHLHHHLNAQSKDDTAMML